MNSAAPRAAAGFPRGIDPARFGQRILLALCGLSPQVVTETLYALAMKRGWVPTRIRLITTGRGAYEAERTLLSGDPGWFRRLCAEYRLPEIEFGPADICVIVGSHGEPLGDILTEADNAAVADFITEQVRALTADPNASLHVSIAGGRKTMGFYVGYALSLFGRVQDRLSHVLVSPPFEQFPEFFYPSLEPRFVRAPDGRTLDARDAQIHLGEIPFIRLREELPQSVQQVRTRFSDAVSEAQKALSPVALHLDPAIRAVTAGGESFALEPAQFAFYWMLAERCVGARGGVRRDEPGLGAEVFSFYRRLFSDRDISDQTRDAYRRFTTDNFDPTKTKINAAIRRRLGERRAAPYLIDRREPVPGTRYHRFGLGLPPEAITITAASLPGR